ncbi:uncharacterized protein VTP21DRAFT_2970 [Calcarisporiella thermophila]|uniref:uncharacterized protein n=1 Tax=Calcarisporiella thermophila TaxID=911321 RepID=UPI00374359F1
MHKKQLSHEDGVALRPWHKLDMGFRGTKLQGPLSSPLPGTLERRATRSKPVAPPPFPATLPTLLSHHSGPSRWSEDVTEGFRRSKARSCLGDRRLRPRMRLQLDCAHLHITALGGYGPITRACRATIGVGRAPLVHHDLRVGSGHRIINENPAELHRIASGWERMARCPFFSYVSSPFSPLSLYHVAEIPAFHNTLLL